MSAKNKKLRAQVEKDPTALERWRQLEAKNRPLRLEASAWHDSIFPADPPTSKKRGREKFPPAFMDAVCEILDVQYTGCMEEGLQSKILDACKNADAGFFRLMAKAAEHVREGANSSVHGRLVRHLKEEAAAMLKKGMEPSRQELIQEVTKKIGNVAPDKASPRWKEAFKAAGLAKLLAKPSVHEVDARLVMFLRQTADAIRKKGMEPTKQELREIVTKKMGDLAPDKASPRWKKAFKAAGLAEIREREEREKSRRG